MISIKLRELYFSYISKYWFQSQPISFLKPIKKINNKANKRYKNLFLIRKSNLLENSNDVNIVRNIKGIKYGIIDMEWTECVSERVNEPK